MTNQLITYWLLIGFIDVIAWCHRLVMSGVEHQNKDIFLSENDLIWPFT